MVRLTTNPNTPVPRRCIGSLCRSSPPTRQRGMSKDRDPATQSHMDVWTATNEVSKASWQAQIDADAAAADQARIDREEARSENASSRGEHRDRARVAALSKGRRTSRRGAV
ncbi:hypothetical protein PLEOSDRAFT_1099783 [Pleurotus ostreatus PC15]|uniref:Uncharacterized protein n=1 Tax=Pleurotus ostreatus (strain PC15) TaxID=1137138 RepID=A0A067P139_PLEO1|nr:hypothetical protein PLEOSDRAFT_1099783 [Pleurotus ostreatus PC15]